MPRRSPTWTRWFASLVLVDSIPPTSDLLSVAWHRWEARLRDFQARGLVPAELPGWEGDGAGSSAERARINIQRRISDALARIEGACAPRARRLSRAIRTGTFCS